MCVVRCCCVLFVLLVRVLVLVLCGRCFFFLCWLEFVVVLLCFVVWCACRRVLCVFMMFAYGGAFVAYTHAC